MICNNTVTLQWRAPKTNSVAGHNSDQCDRVLHRERPESRVPAVPVVSVDPLDPQDPLDWLEPLASLDVRYSSDGRTSTTFSRARASA